MQMGGVGLISALLVVGLGQPAFAASRDQWRTRTIYQLLTDRFANPNAGGDCNDLSNYCGGTYEGAISKLDYIQALGFDAVWISPVVSQVGNGYHGYWAKDIYQLNDHFGDLQRFVTACHARGIYVMVDVVANHMGCIKCTDFSSLNPFNSSSHYHSYCDINDFNNQNQVENCRLAGLPDLAQENTYVRETLKSWIHNLVQTYGFDGIRIDTIPEVPKPFWDEFVDAAGVFAVGEVFNGGLPYVQGYESHVGAVMNYPLFFLIRDVFGSQRDMDALESDYFKQRGVWQDVDMNPVFVDNHDNQRFLGIWNDYGRYKSALTFAMTQPLSIGYYGAEQGFTGGNDPYNRQSLWPHYSENGELFLHIQTTNKFRHHYAHELQQAFVQRYAAANFYAYSRGNVTVALTNRGSASYVVTYHPYAVNTRLCNIYVPNDCVVVAQSGIPINLSNGQPKVYVPTPSRIAPQYLSLQPDL
eukprot:c14974_g1_i2.p1 GENE.c14974_g1_i2~~c14974_g1_i2.p1  ORF type:complete len:471 (+),score=79.90 c14974_g1_i2:22-1434(+)